MIGTSVAVSYSVVFSPASAKNLNKLPEKIAAAVVEFVYSGLAANPYRVGKPLRGKYEGCYSARRSSYRILYRIDDGTVTVEVIKVAFRPDAYH